MEPIKDKLLALLIQLRPTYELKEGLEDLRTYDFFFDDTYRFAIEVRHLSWFSDLAYNFFRNSNVALVWSQMDRLQTPPIVTSDFIYLRLIGDRRLAKDQFGKIQIDRGEEIRKWANKIKEVRQNEKDVNAAIVAANNHYGGYGPGTVDIFRENLDTEKLTFENVDIKKINHQLQLENRFSWESREKENQTSLTDFI